MYWVIQYNLYRETGIVELLSILERAKIPHSEHKVIPFVGELEPDVDLHEPVICIGSYSMRHLAKRKGWKPGVFDLFDYDMVYCDFMWQDEMLNGDCIFVTIKESYFEFTVDNPLFFIRPVKDSKDFAGDVFNCNEWKDFTENVDKGDDMYGLTSETEIIMATPKNIIREYRIWVVDGHVITGSQYKIDGRVNYYGVIDNDIWSYADKMTKMIGNDLPRAYVMDIALLKDGNKKIIEFNTFNAAGLYNANVGKIVDAIEGMDI